MLRVFVYTCTQAIILAFFKSDHHFEKGGKSGLLAEEEERKGEMREETMEMKVGMGETMRGGDVVCVGESCPLTAHPFLHQKVAGVCVCKKERERQRPVYVGKSYRMITLIFMERLQACQCFLVVPHIYARDRDCTREQESERERARAHEKERDTHTQTHTHTHTNTLTHTHIFIYIDLRVCMYVYVDQSLIS